MVGLRRCSQKWLDHILILYFRYYFIRFYIKFKKKIECSKMIANLFCTTIIIDLNTDDFVVKTFFLIAVGTRYVVYNADFNQFINYA